MRRLLTAIGAAALVLSGCAPDEPVPPASPSAGTTPSDAVTLQIESRSWGYSDGGTYSETVLGSTEVTLAPGETVAAPEAEFEFTFVGWEGEVVELEANAPWKTSEAQSPDNASTQLRIDGSAEFWSPSEDGGDLVAFTVIE